MICTFSSNRRYSAKSLIFWPFLLLGALSLPMQVVGQGQKGGVDSVEMIVVGKDLSADSTSRGEGVTKSARRDFFRKRNVYLLPLMEGANSLLVGATQTPDQKGPGKGLIPLLIEGLFKQDFDAQDPLNPQWEFGYTDLFWEMVELSGISEEEAFELPVDSLPWFHMESLLLLGVEEGLTHMGTSFHTLKFIGLVWDPFPVEEPPRVLCLVPISHITELLKHTYCTWQGPHPEIQYQTPVWRWLESRQYRGFRIDADQPEIVFRPGPYQDRSQYAMPEWYKP